MAVNWSLFNNFYRTGFTAYPTLKTKTPRERERKREREREREREEKRREWEIQRGIENLFNSISMGNGYLRFPICPDVKEV